MAPISVSSAFGASADHTVADVVQEAAKSAISDGILKSAQPLPARPQEVASEERFVQELDASRLVTRTTTSPKPALALNDPARNTCAYCTDHMVTAVWRADSGWEAPELRPYEALSIMPSASVLHYATECFEGLKAYRGHDGKLRLFRPDLNALRMLKSAVRIALPTFDPKAFTELVVALMAKDGPKFLPRDQPGQFVYLRPTLIGTTAATGVRSPKDALLFVFACYMPELSLRPQGMRLIASGLDEIRAWPGGYGFAKVGANYGPTIVSLGAAQARGFDQMLWLFGQEGTVTESGGANFFILWRSKEGTLQMQTAPLTDQTILEGVTRRSIIDLTKERLGQDHSERERIEVVEQSFTMDDIVAASDEGRIVEAFCCGTAFFVIPVSSITYKERTIEIPRKNGQSGPYTALLRSWLADIMYGNVQHEWAVVVDEQ